MWRSSGLVAAVLDEVLGLPTEALRLTFGWMIAALNGANYAFFKRHDDRAGLLMSAVAGLVAFVMWFIVMEIIGGDFGLSYGLNVFKAIVTDHRRHYRLRLVRHHAQAAGQADPVSGCASR